jgi:hypothetical protein
MLLHPVGDPPVVLVAAHPEWHLAEEHVYRDDAYSGAKLNQPGLDRLRDRAAMVVFERVLMSPRIAWPATMSIKCSYSTNLPNEAVRSSFWTARRVRTRMTNCCCRSEARWRSMGEADVEGDLLRARQRNMSGTGAAASLESDAAALPLGG